MVLQSQPQLQKGVNIVHKPDKLPVFQSLVGSEIGGRNAGAVWLDSRNECSTYALSSYGRDLLEKVKVGRAFTPFQHHSIVQQVEDFIEEKTELLVLPNIDFLYIDGQIRDWEAEQLFKETWNKILNVQKEYDLKVLVSHSKGSQLSYLVDESLDNKICVDRTSQGWKYDSEDFDQMIYGDGGEVQTTMPYWSRKTSETVTLRAKEM